MDLIFGVKMSKYDFKFLARIKIKFLDYTLYIIISVSLFNISVYAKNLIIFLICNVVYVKPNMNI